MGRGRRETKNLDGGVEGKERDGHSDILHEGKGWYHSLVPLERKMVMCCYGLNTNKMNIRKA